MLTKQYCHYRDKQSAEERWHVALSFSDALPEIVFSISRGFAEGTDCNLLKNETNFIKLLSLDRGFVQRFKQ